LQAIRAGEVDALVFPTTEGERVFVLRDTDEPYRVLVEQLQEGAIIASPDGDILYCNQRFADLLDRPLELVIGSPLLDHISPEDHDLVSDLLVPGRPAAHRAEIDLLNESSTARPVQLSVAPYAVDGAAALCIVVTDLSDQRRREALVADERLARSILEHVAEAVVVCDLNGVVTRANQEARRLGGERIIGFAFAEAFPLHFSGPCQDAAELLAGTLRGDRYTMVEAVLPSDSGKPHQILVSGGPLYDATAVAGAVISMVNITEHKAAEERLRQLQRLDSVGRLAGGVAHEVNNQMTVVLGFADMISRNPDLPQRVQGDMKQIQRAAVRSAAITAQLLAFGRKQILRPQVLDVNEVVRGFEPVLSQTLGADIRLHMALSADSLMVLCDRGQLEQVLLNLVRNARDAISHSGLVTVESRHTLLDADAFEPHNVAVRAGSYVVLAVHDSGCGMPPDVLPRVFEPFFTTKQSGQGTGLGLSSVYGIVKQSGGYVWVSSEPGKGTVVTVYLPRSNAPPRLDTPTELPAAQRHSETILVVDDEQGVLAMMSQALTDSGFTVIQTADGYEALTALRSRTEPPHAVVTDLVMQGMDGRELARRMGDEFPGIPILFTSGFASDDVVGRGLLDPGQPFLQKPFLPTDLVLRVRTLIDDYSSRVARAGT
jgi:two-component system cell cycle sensor histidine kinase/response regulator CckA